MELEGAFSLLRCKCYQRIDLALKYSSGDIALAPTPTPTVDYIWRHLLLLQLARCSWHLSGWRAGMLLNILQRAGQPYLSQQRIMWPKRSIVPRLSNVSLAGGVREGLKEATQNWGWKYNLKILQAGYREAKGILQVKSEAFAKVERPEIVPPL